jgi:hypothetical protein
MTRVTQPLQLPSREFLRPKSAICSTRGKILKNADSTIS